MLQKYLIQCRNYGIGCDAGTGSAEANERVTEGGELADQLRLETTIGLPPLLGSQLPGAPPPLALAAVDDDGDVRLGRELAGQVGEQLGLLAIDDEEMLGHEVIM